MTDKLLSPTQLGELRLDNHLVMAPLTRARASKGHMPNAMMAEHYAQRASAGLIIVEATMISEGHSAFINEPGIYNQQQVEAWREVTDAVHQRGGQIVLQIWHGGRACHPVLNGGKTPVAPSALAIDGEVLTPEGKLPYTEPRALQIDELPAIVEDFRQAAERAKQAGFDGVEVHAANGYLLDTFLRDGSNQRQDAYGGSLENRARLLFEVLEAVCQVYPSQRVGVRTSPLNSFNDMRDSDPEGQTAWLAEQLNRFDLAYWHLMRGDFFQQQQGDVISPARQNYRGKLLVNMGYSPELAEQALQQNLADAVALGVPFIGNPDLVERIKQGAELNSADPETFYSPGAKGYTDYPTLAQSACSL